MGIKSKLKGHSLRKRARYASMSKNVASRFETAATRSTKKQELRRVRGRPEEVERWAGSWKFGIFGSR